MLQQHDAEALYCPPKRGNYRLEVEIFLNGPTSQTIEEALRAELGVQAGESIFALYEDAAGNRRTAEIILTAVSQ